MKNYYHSGQLILGVCLLILTIITLKKYIQNTDIEQNTPPIYKDIHDKKYKRRKSLSSSYLYILDKGKNKEREYKVEVPRSICKKYSKGQKIKLYYLKDKDEYIYIEKNLKVKLLLLIIANILMFFPFKRFIKSSP